MKILRSDTEHASTDPHARRTGQGDLEFRALLDAAVDAIIVIDHLGIVQEFNLAAQRLFGYAADEVLGHNVHMLMPEPYHHEHDGYLARYHRTGEARIIGIGREVHARRRDGSVFPCDLAVGKVTGIDPPRYIGFIRDITRRKQADEQLLRSEAELRLAQELANLGNYVAYLDGSHENYYSPQLYRIFGLEPGSPTIPLPLYIARWVHPGDQVRIRAAIEQFNGPTGESLDIEYRIVRPDGETRHVHHIAQAVRDEMGRTIRHSGTLHDVTERRLAEDETRQVQERLTHFSRLSTMGEMAAGLAHEINQPLTAIANYAQACQRLIRLPQCDQQDVVEALEQIKVQALRAGEVIRRLRNFVKNREVRREPVDCGQLLEELRTLAETDARLHNVRLVLRVQEGLPHVQADPVQLQQVVLNLVRNAIDAMADVPEAEREVVLSTEHNREGELEVIVADRGSGLSPEASEHLFNPFFTTKTGGTGLGLAISRSIVRAHGGRLWHTPNEGSGARFHFTLPVSPATSRE